MPALPDNLQAAALRDAVRLRLLQCNGSTLPSFDAANKKWGQPPVL